MKAEEFVKEMKKIYEKTKAALKKLQEEMKKYRDRNKKEVVEYKVGDKVLLSTKNLIRKCNRVRVIDLNENSPSG